MPTETWFGDYSGAFTAPPRALFTRIYFSSDRRGEADRDEAAKTLEALAGEPRESPASSKLGDRLMFLDFYGDRMPAQLVSQFGPEFATALCRAKPGSWQGPMASGYGWHLVFVDAITSSAAGSRPASGGRHHAQHPAVCL